MSDDAFASYLTHWREADSQRATAWLFLRHDERLCYGALAALEAEWQKAVHDAREPQVAAAKLSWWREEMQRAAQGGARHPLTQSLFTDSRVQAVPVACWTAAVDASLLVLAATPPVDGAAQVAAATPLAAAFANLETRIWFGAPSDPTRATTVIAIAQLLSSLRGLAAGGAVARAPLPMNLMARHGLTVDDLGRDTPALRNALRDHSTALERALAHAATMDGPLSLFRAVSLQHDLHTLRHAAHADDPLVALLAPQRGFRNLLKTWRAARTWRGIRTPEAMA